MSFLQNLWNYFTAEHPLMEQWRHVQWEKKNEDFDYVNKFKPHSAAQHLRILLHGPPASGKSSFINSVDSALRGRISTRALADCHYGGSYTKDYRSYQIQRKATGTFYPLVFSDTMGLEQVSGRGINVENMKLIMRGHVNEGCELLPGSVPTGSHYNENPTVNDKVHVLVCVVPATTTRMDDNFFKNMRKVREDARDLRIPQVAILTRIDEACPEVNRDMKNVYKSKFLRRQVETLSTTLGIPMNCIFLVKNYTEQIKTDDETDALILNTMRQIIDYGEDFLNDLSSTGKPAIPSEAAGVSS